MSLFNDSIGLPRIFPRVDARRKFAGISLWLDGLLTPARRLNHLIHQRAELRAARHALELSLKPKVQIYLHCKTPDGRACVELLM